MRLVADVHLRSEDIKRVEIHQSSSGVFLYLYGRLEKAPRIGEEWYESRASAQDACRRRFGIEDEDWSRLD